MHNIFLVTVTVHVLYNCSVRGGILVLCLAASSDSSFFPSIQADFEKLYEFKMFLKHLKQKIEQADTDYADTNNCTVGPDGVTRGHEDNSASLESGAFLSIARVGYSAQVSTCCLAYTYWN